MTDSPNRQLAALLEQYRRDLRQIASSPDLDARIDRLVAGGRQQIASRFRRRRAPWRWIAAAGVAGVAIVSGIHIGAALERHAIATKLIQQPTVQAEDFSLWPADSVALQIPAEYSMRGTLVAVNPASRSTGRRYVIHVVVSNDGTFRIDRIVPAENPDVAKPQIQ